MKEEWKQINNHPNYMCSSFGRIKNTATGKIYNGKVNSKGYVRFDLSENGKRFVIHGHRIVAECFIPKIEGKTFINHIDGDKTNNVITNLEWCTPLENVQHAMNVLGKELGGENKKKILCIETGEEFESSYDAERKLGIPNPMINRCCNGKQKSTKGLHFQFI